MARFSFIVEMASRLIVGFVLFSLLLFLPAGTLDWPEAWAFIIILLTYGLALHFLIFEKYPDALQSRRHYKPAFGIDTIILLFAGIFFILVFVIAGLDAGRFNWTSSHVPYLHKYLGFAALVCSLILYMLVMRENVYLSRVIEIQEKQKVITTGPYSFVRHPMYLGNVLFVLSIPIALGSYLAVIPAIIFLILFVPRIIFEERILMKELAGYKEYMQEVRYRVIPKVW